MRKRCNEVFLVGYKAVCTDTQKTSKYTKPKIEGASSSVPTIMASYPRRLDSPKTDLSTKHRMF
jgi:hypothetical protein